MKASRWGCVVVLLIALVPVPALTRPGEQLVHHEIKTDAQGNIVPWYSPDPAIAYDQAVRSVWDFWKNMKSCPNGVKYYMQHQVWKHPQEDERGLGGDQLCMALSSWSLLYQYLGDRALVDDMMYMADYWIDHGFSPANAAWPNLPYPYNTELHSGRYDGDMRAGVGYLQPDKAGSFGAELVVLFKITGKRRYLEVARQIADTLSAKVIPGDNDRSPWPYRVHAVTGQVNMAYTSNFTGALRLFSDLAELKEGDVQAYSKSFATASEWLRNYPIRTNKWGPFFEDIPSWSDTEINADTMAWYMLEHPDWNPNWKEDSRRILTWSRSTFGNHQWTAYGVTPINEQTAYLVPGNSHTSRHASVQLVYAEKTGDTTLKEEAIRQLSWATYMVGDKGNNRYPYDDVWLTDGYGDYVRHYMRAMAAAPELSPAEQDHLLKSSSVIENVGYQQQRISYDTHDASSEALLRVSFRPDGVMVDGNPLPLVESVEALARREGYTFNAPGDIPGVMRIRHQKGKHVVISGSGSPGTLVAKAQRLTTGMDQTLSIELEVVSSGSGIDASLSYAVGRPGHGKLSGEAPHLTYRPDHGYEGSDSFSFSVARGAGKSNVALITVDIARPNLALFPGCLGFVTANSQTGGGRIFPLNGLNDGDIQTDVVAGPDISGPTDVGIGLLWQEPLSVRQLVLRQGSPGEGRAFFSSGLRVSVSESPEKWTLVDTVLVFPSTPVPGAATDFIFTFPEARTCLGVKIEGPVSQSGTGAARFVLRELKAFAGLGVPSAPKIEHSPESQSVAPGESVIFGVRPFGTAFHVYQWQKSGDQGKTWKNIPGATGSYHAVHDVRETDSGAQFRCVLSNGTPPEAVSRPATLKVIPG